MKSDLFHAVMYEYLHNREERMLRNLDTYERSKIVHTKRVHGGIVTKHNKLERRKNKHR
jgi:hypothetical protein